MTSEEGVEMMWHQAGNMGGAFELVPDKGEDVSGSKRLSMQGREAH